MLEINHLTCSVKDTDYSILDNFSLKIMDGEVHVIMGPNGAGKSTLSKVIMGHYQYEVHSGDILFDGESILNLEVYERSKKGIFLCMQDPTVIDGVSNSEFLRTARSSITGEKVNLFTFMKDLETGMKELSLDSGMMHRSLNKGFSGGEKKKNEILQMKMLKPKMILLDELDSGLDVDSLKIVCDNINSYLKENKKASLLIITHYPKILEYIKPNYVHILKDGKIIQTGDYQLALDIEKNGYHGILELSGDENHE
ncbi:MAG: Fe-S cluster assembly ATPase SufC [Bacilli bacterium]|nr:Fe-S cluster assembly ATPase SufC [Bacilli bacterium]